MFYLEIIFIGLALCVDSFTAALAMGNYPFNRKDALKFATSSGLAEAVAAYIGAIAGAKVIARFAAIDHWVAFTLLMGVAAHMAYEGYENFKNKNSQNERLDFHSFTKILIVSIATSLDAFGVGISLGISHKPLGPYITSIGAWAFIATIAGLYLARALSSKLGSIMSLIGAFVLTGLAFQMLSI